uniref:Uncharacterized protein n=1 Tax=Brassica oleracea TaxID=3712 RepID=A0A3P6CLA3_BRAOL|nr:unnamed protein product [Brassica oleracea]
MLKRLLTTSAFSPKGVNWVRSFASGAGKGGFASGAWNVGFSSGAGNGGFASGSASGGDENGGSASGGDGNGGSASGGDGNGGSASGGAGNGGSESENNGGGQRSYRLCPPSLEQKLEDLQKECNQWEDHFRKAKDMFSSQDGDRKEHVKSCEIRSLERYLTYLKEETYIWNVKGVKSDLHRVMEEIEESLFQAAFKMTIRQSTCHWIEQSSYWLERARSLGVKVETGKGTIEVDYGQLDIVFTFAKDAMRSLLNWSVENGGFMSDLIIPEIRRSLIEELGLSVEEAFYYWLGEIFHLGELHSHCKDVKLKLDADV